MPRMSQAKAMNAPTARWKQVGGAFLPLAGLAAMAVSASALSALATAFPDSGGMADLAGTCDPRGVDFGCFCYMLPSDGAKLD